MCSYRNIFPLLIASTLESHFTLVSKAAILSSIESNMVFLAITLWANWQGSPVRTASRFLSVSRRQAEKCRSLDRRRCFWGVEGEHSEHCRDTVGKISKPFDNASSDGPWKSYQCCLFCHDMQTGKKKKSKCNVIDEQSRKVSVSMC